jgi:hypothetical protein
MANCQETRRIFCIGFQLLSSQRLVPFFWHVELQLSRFDQRNIGKLSILQKLLSTALAISSPLLGNHETVRASVKLLWHAACICCKKKDCNVYSIFKRLSFITRKTGQLTLPLPSRRVFTWNLKPNTYRNGMAIIKPCMYSTFTYI